MKNNDAHEVRLFKSWTLLIAMVAGSVVAWAVDSPAAWPITFRTGDRHNSGAIALAEAPKSVRKDGSLALSPTNNADYFKRKGIAFRINVGDVPLPKTLYIVIEHRDSNLGLIDVRYDADIADSPDSPGSDSRYENAKPLAGYTALGTNKHRRSVFQLTKPAFRHRQLGGADIQIDGVASLTGISIQSQLPPTLLEDVSAEIPVKVPTQLKLAKPMQLVISFGSVSFRSGDLPNTLKSLHEFCPLADAMGFDAIESYVKWNAVEQEKGKYDWSYYDAIVEEAQRHDLKWFPLLVGASAYTLPKWYFNSPENVGFECLEHHKRNNIQTIFTDIQTPYMLGLLKSFGDHYGSSKALLGVRMGASGNFGESQYPAGGNWGYESEKEHIHVGWWAGDAYAAPRFREYLKKHYPSIADLNATWGSKYASFDEVKPFIPQFAETKRMRKDFEDWYIDAMTEWCDRWAVWTRNALPNTPVYQSSGGWGFEESGTDFTDQTKSMVAIHGGIRATNETDSYAQNFYATRMLSSAARFYGVPFGSEPAGFGSARGVMARLYNILVNNGQHLFYYYPNLLANDQGVDKWLKYGPLLDEREDPFVEIAALYLDTDGKLDDSVFRNLYAFSFNREVAALRPRFDFDFCSEHMVLDGALPRYKVLLLLSNHVIEKNALDAIDAWVRSGGTVVAAYWLRQPIGTVEDDYAVFNRWLRGDTGNGRVIMVRDDRETPTRLAEAITKSLLTLSQLDPRTQGMLRSEKPDEVYLSVLKSGRYAVLNYRDDIARVRIPGERTLKMEPYSIALTKR